MSVEKLLRKMLVSLVVFTPPKKLSENIWEPARVGYGIWNPLLKINISKRLIGLQNILYLINTQIKHPTQQNNHPEKSILALIVKLLKDHKAPTTLHIVRAYTNIKGNEEADKLAKEGNKIDPKNDMSTQAHENAHSTPYLVVPRC
jgi:hypothetical protein